MVLLSEIQIVPFDDLAAQVFRSRWFGVGGLGMNKFLYFIS